MIIVFDIDHVVADSRHREPLIRQPERDWVTYYDLLPDDPVVLPVYHIMSDLGNTGRHKMFLCTGRHEHTRDITTQWFKDQGLWRYIKGGLLMRPSDVFCANAVAKEPMAQQIINQEGRIDLVFEDNPDSVAMWKKYAALVFEVKYGQAA